jgi:aspartyl-tRNA(Asn)/glutamyl-tRNA(Gln) amidotransferase subunit A
MTAHADEAPAPAPTVASLHRAFRAGKLLPSEALQTSLERIAENDPVLHSFVMMNPDAEEEARRSDERWRAGIPIGVLDGIPVGVKDNLVTRGVRSTWASRMYEFFVPGHDEVPIARLREQGAVLVGKTNTSEFASGHQTVNDLFPRTANPWDTSRTAGGSSGGAAASVAGGLVPLSVGTDGGGSTRRPAALTGVVGYKPSVDRIARGGGFAPLMYDMEVVGLLTTTVEDVRLAARSMTSRHDAAPRRGPLSVRLVTGLSGRPVDPTAVEAATLVAGILERAGHHVQSGTLPFDLDDLTSAMGAVMSAGFARLAESPTFELVSNPDFRALATSPRVADEAEAIEWMLRFRAMIAAEFASTDIIVTPTSSTQAWAVDQDFPSLIDKTPASPRDHGMFTPWVNAAGACGISIPVCVDASGMPVGVQVAAAMGQDETLLSVAEQLEQVLMESGVWPNASTPRPFDLRNDRRRPATSHPTHSDKESRP